MALRVVLTDGRQKSVRSYEFDQGELRTVDSDGSANAIRVADIDVERTLAANAGIDFERGTEPFDAGAASLQLLARNTRNVGDFCVVQGSVRNLSPVDLEHIVVRATTVDPTGATVVSEEALLDQARLHAGMESGFRVVLRGAATASLRLSFHQLFGDELSAVGVESSNPFAAPP